MKWKLLTEEHPNYLQNREVAIELCKKDPLFFFNNFLFTYDTRITGEIKNKHIPFILYDYQEEGILSLVEHIEKGIDQLWEKSRDMGASWCIVGVAHWGWKFHGWDVHLGSRVAGFVDERGNMSSLIEKVRYMERKLPEWLQLGLKEGVTDKSMLLINPITKNALTGESNNPYFGTGGRYKFVMLDEFAKWESTDDIAWRSLGDATPCRIANSTPSERGMNCHFYDLIKSGIDRITLHWVNHPKKNRGLYYLMHEKKMFLNPDNKDDINKALDLWKAGIQIGSDWYDYEKEERRSETEIAQELDIAYDASLAGGIFPNFDFKTQLDGELEYDANLPLYVGWDFGIDRTSMIFVQKKFDKFYIIDEYEEKDLDITHFIEILRAKPYREALHYGDPYSGNARQSSSISTTVNILKAAHIRMYAGKDLRTSQRDEINAAKIILKNSVVSETYCPLFIGTLQNWRYKKPARGNDMPVPEHSTWSHLGKAFCYLALGIGTKRQSIVKSRYNQEEGYNR